MNREVGCYTIFMRIVSLNLSGYKDWVMRAPQVIDFLNKVDADFVFFQEVRLDLDISPLAQSDLINSSLASPLPYTSSSISRYYEPSVDKPYREGLAVLSRHPILKEETLALTKASDDKHQRIIQNLDIDVAGEVIRFSNIHLSNNHNSNNQLKEVLSIFDSRNEKRIIVGDFNIPDLDSHSQTLDDEYTISTKFSNYISYPSKNQTLDYILLPPGFSCKSLKTVDDLSDHSALVCLIDG